MSLKISLYIAVSLLILSVLIGCVSSSGDIDIIGSWQIDEHVSPSVNQKYVKVVWVNLTETRITLHWYEPQDSLELAEAATAIFETGEFDKL